jgi:hypothetical protein
MSRYQKIICIHPLDETTMFLKPIRDIFSESSIQVEHNFEAHNSVLEQLSNLSERSLILFLGHGSSQLLKGASFLDYEQEHFIDNNQAKHLFANHDVFLLSCNSSDFLKSFSSYNSSIGFGNILSSIEEVEIEQKFRDINVDAEDIEIFKSAFVNAIYNSLLRFNQGRIKFSELSIYIRYNVNKEINIILLNKGIVNRREIAKLLFEFRDEMTLYI